jgi:hypothetical protein
MSSIKVVDLNEGGKEEPPIPEAIKEEEQQQVETVNEVFEEANEVVEEAPPEEAPEQPPKAKPKAKPKASDLVFCEKCNRQITYKNLRYSHKCSPEPPPVKRLLFIGLTVYTLYITLIPVLLWLKKTVCASWLFVAS